MFVNERREKETETGKRTQTIEFNFHIENLCIKI
jgi:hypothetical protein